MDIQAVLTKTLSPDPVSTPTKLVVTEKPTTTEENKTSLGKRKKSEPSEGNTDGTDDIDSVIMIEPRNKIQKVNHSTTIDGESVAKMESEIMLEPTEKNKMKTSQKSEPSEGNSDGSDDLDSVIVSEPRKQIQKVNHSNTIEKMTQMKFVQTKMSCACGEFHTITLSDDGIVHSFGRNWEGQLGLGHNDEVSLPTPIPNLPQINMISCGWYFTVCVDHESFIWSFGENTFGQLGTGNKTNFNVPQKLQNIPPVVSVSCGSDHTLVITNDDNLWSWGRNEFGQLCHLDEEDHKESRSKPQKTSFSNISKISTGYNYSLFQNNKGEIFACGNNRQGQCGLGHFNSPQITPSLIPNVPSNIVHFVCGSHQNLFLDSEGNVYSVGSNGCGQLGLGHNTDQNELNKIPNIPPIKIISCAGSSSYLIDFEGNLWTFGDNDDGQLGHDDEEINTPKVINTVKDIQQISHGSSGLHFLVKNSQNQIIVSGYNGHGQLGTGDTQSLSTPKEINSQHSTIWRDEFLCRAKSARK